MNAAETIQAAIDKLRTLLSRSNDNSTRGIWSSRPSVPGTADIFIDYGSDDYEPQVVASEMYEADAELAVVLHATIDMQLDILTTAWNEWSRTNHIDSHDEPNHSWQALELARAILRGQVDA